MGGGYIVPEAEFAKFGGYRTGMTYNGGSAEYGMYHLEGVSGGHWATAASGTQATADIPCNTWDCIALSLDATSIGGNVLMSAGLAGELPTGGMSTAAVVSGLIINQTATAAGLVHTVRSYSLGKASTADLIVNSATATLNPFPWFGSVAGGAQLAWDIFDPIIPD